VLTKYYVQDLNKDWDLKELESQSFDACLIQLSVDYLTQPINVLKEISRVLRPGGTLAISFSNRIFISKAIAAWTGKSDLDHIERVGGYIRLASPSTSSPYISSSPSSSSSSSSVRGFDLRTLSAFAPKEPKRGSGEDPLYVVTVQAN
jgi:ubiquinone/menaquinone biosynthesis C-methylase UbiE